MKWFIVKYMYQIIIGEGNHTPQFDEQIRLLMAFDSAEALNKAESQADGFHKPFANHNGELVTWKFICIADLNEIDQPHDGQELCSSLHEPEDVSEFLGFAYKRKEYLEMDVAEYKTVNF